MRITDEMVQRFEDADYLTQFAKTTEDAALLRNQVRAGLVAVAPMIAEQAQAGYIEQAHRLRHAESLLRAIMTVQPGGYALLFAQARELLDPIDFPDVPDAHQ